MIGLTVFSSIFDNKTDVKVEFDNFDQLERSLYHLSTLPGYKGQRGEFSKKSSPLISPAIYKPGTTRANVNVECWGGWAALDVDDHEFKYDLEFELSTRYSGIRFVCYSTASSTREKPKFRLVFPLTGQVEASKITHFWHSLNVEFGQIGDSNAKDKARLFFVPAMYPNAYNFIFSNPGSDINPDELMAKHPWKPPTSSSNFFDRLPLEMQRELVLHRQHKLEESRSAGRDIRWTSYIDCPFVNQNMISEYKSISKQDGSGRYAMIYSIMASTACSAVRRGYPINEHEIVDLVRQLDRESSNIYAKRPLNVEASRAIEFAYRSI